MVPPLLQSIHVDVLALSLIMGVWCFDICVFAFAKCMAYDDLVHCCLTVLCAEHVRLVWFLVILVIRVLCLL